MRRRLFKSNSGFLLITSYVFIVLIVGILVSLSIRMGTSTAVAIYQAKREQSRYLAMAGIERVKTELHNAFMNYFYGPSGAWTESSFQWFDNLLTDSPPYSFPVQGSLPTGDYIVELLDVEDCADDVGRIVKLRSTGTSAGVSVSVVTWMWYGLERSKVFDYVYFINNYGWFWGSGITANGDVRSNGDFSLRYGPKINGDVYAGVDPELGSSGTIYGTSVYDSLSTYYATAPLRARPGNPTYPSEDVNGNGLLDPGEDTNGNGQLDTYEYSDGYDGTSVHYDKQMPVVMPYLGDLGFYKTVATQKRGKIIKGGTTLVDGVYEGNLVLIGTDADPIEIEGPVVITGDVIIKGKVKGQGVIYAGRNVHIVGSIKYVDPPKWKKPDTNPSATDDDNLSKDFLGLAAKGNVIIGDYTDYHWYNSCGRYLRPPFTTPYKVEPSDAGNGYVTSYDAEGNPWFNGNYTAYDGGKKEDGSPRRYYESSLTNWFIRSISDDYRDIKQIDAFIYTNHAVAGTVGNLTLNGGIVARDEAIRFLNKLTLNYDIRVKNLRFRDKFYLPRDLSEPKVWVWEEE